MTEPSINSLFTLFAQFIGHNLSSAANDKDGENKQINCQCQEKIKNPFYMNIPTSNIFDEIYKFFLRSNAREQIDQVNSYFDASMMYGNNENKVHQYQAFKNGQFKMMDRSLPPEMNTEKEGNDTCSNENIGLTSLRIKNSFWSDNIIDHKTHRILTGILQHIIYIIIPNEFATGTCRLGYALINDFVCRFNNQHKMIEEISLSHVIFRSMQTFN